MTPLDLVPPWPLAAELVRLGAAVVLVALVYLASAAIAVLLGFGIVVVRRRSAWPSVAEDQALAAIERERTAGEDRIDALAWAFDQQVAQIVARRRSPDDAHR
jgi:hypothetical protein